ncbi:MAG: hypothetical protein ABUJ98_15935, partial [Hyphomicrobium sp.]
YGGAQRRAAAERAYTHVADGLDPMRICGCGHSWAEHSDDGARCNGTYPHNGEACECEGRNDRTMVVLQNERRHGYDVYSMVLALIVEARELRPRCICDDFGESPCLAHPDPDNPDRSVADVLMQQRDTIEDLREQRRDLAQAFLLMLDRYREGEGLDFRYVTDAVPEATLRKWAEVK